MPRAKVSGIYVIRNTDNGKVYVGKSVDVEDRWRHHRRQLIRNKHVNPHLQASWNRAGPASFVFEVVEEAASEHLPILEAKWMAHLRSSDRELGYNLDLETGSGKTMSAETRAKIGAANKGKVRSPEARAHMRLVKAGQGAGRVKSEQELANMRAAHAKRAEDPDGYAWFRSPEGRAVMSLSGKKGASVKWNKRGGS